MSSEGIFHPTGSHPSWSNLLHLRFYSGNNLRVHRNVPIFYMDLWPACAHPEIPLHLCYQKNSDCPTAMWCALDLVEFEQGGKILIHFFHNHVRNKVKSPHPHTTIKWVTAASHAPPCSVRCGTIRHGLCRCLLPVAVFCTFQCNYPACHIMGNVGCARLG